MAFFLNELGLGAFAKDEQSVKGLLAYVASKGKAITGYQGCPYINEHLGKAQLILNTKINSDGGLETTCFDTHIAGDCVWKMKVHEANIQPEGKESTERRHVFTRADDTGMVVINIVNYDVLPSCVKDDIITMQVMGFAIEIDFFENESVYNKSLPKDKNGESLSIAPNTLFPSGLITNRTPERAAKGKCNDNADEITGFHGVIEKILWGETEFEEEKDEHAFVICRIKTNFGDLQIVCSNEQMDKAKETAKVGAVVSGLLVLSADVAIYDLEKGAIYNEENDLRVLRQFFIEHEIARIKNIFADNVIYHSDASDIDYVGKTEVINRLDYVAKNTNIKYCANLAVVESIRDFDKKKDYPIGKRYVALSEDNEAQNNACVFIEVNNDGKITKIHILYDERYAIKRDNQIAVVNSINKILGITTTDDGKSIKQKEDLFIEIVMLNMIYHGNYARVKAKLVEKHGDIIKTEKQAYLLISFCVAREQNHSISYTKDNHIHLIEDMAENFKEYEIKAQKNDKICNKNLDDDDWGIIPTKPIYCKDVHGSNEYLSKLTTAKGETLTWQRYSMSAEGIIGLVDSYDGFLPNGKKYKTVYINMYSNNFPTTAPKGFKMTKGSKPI